MAKKEHRNNGGNTAKDNKHNLVTHSLWVNYRKLKLDKRTRLSKTIVFLKKELTAHVGDPSLPQQILIDRAIHKVIKCHLYEVNALNSPDVGSRDHYLALCNSLRLDLQALGLEKKARELPDLQKYLQQKETNP